MPIYEFVCSNCNRKFRKLVGVVANVSAPACPRCSSIELNRQISRFARVRSEDDALDGMADEMEAMGDTDDPRVMAKMMKQLGREMGEDLDDDIEEMIEAEANGDGGDEPDGE